MYNIFAISKAITNLTGQQVDLNDLRSALIHAELQGVLQSMQGLMADIKGDVSQHSWGSVDLMLETLAESANVARSCITPHLQSVM